MIDMRRTKSRRTGERLPHVIGVWILLAAILSVAVWGGYEAGKYRVISTTVTELKSDLVVAKAIAAVPRKGK